MYITLNELKKALGQNLTAIQQVLDDNDLIEIITNLTSFIDDCIKAVVVLPLENPPQIIKRICQGLAVYDVHKLIAWDDVSEVIQKEYSSVLKLLDKIQKRVILLGNQTNDDGEDVNLQYKVDNQYFTHKM